MIWGGTLELGDIAIPVGLASTIRDGSEHLKRLHAACSSPVALRTYCELDQALLQPDEIVEAWEVAPGEYLVVDEDARSALKPVESRRIPIGGFVTTGSIQPALVRKRYYLVPSSIVAWRAYFLLAAAIAELDVAGLVRFTWRGEQLGAVTSREGHLELATLHPAEDLVGLDEELAVQVDAIESIDDELLELGRELVDRHTRPLRPDDLASHERPRVRALLERLLAGEQIIRPEPAVDEHERPAAAADLEGALRRSLKQAPPRPRRRRAAVPAR